MTATFSESDVSKLVEVHPGNRIFREVLERASEPERLFKVLANYIAFNGTFGAGVANLAGEIGVRQDLFRDVTDPHPMLADRSMEIGADILYAAIDEFDDRSTSYKSTHRTLASATLVAAARYLGLNDEAFKTLAAPSSDTLEAITKVRHGYGVSRTLEARDLLSSMGFHISSEILADEEFRILDSHLRSAHSALVEYLERETVELNGYSHNAYWWVHIHTSVEADHFDLAMRGVNCALRYYAGTESSETLKGWVLAGFDEFATLQRQFMEGLAKL